MTRWHVKGHTPKFPQEKWVKEQIKSQLEKLGIWYFMPSANGYGKPGIPDFICCSNAHFIAIEAKRKDGEWSQPQQDRCKEISLQEGVYILVDETGLDELWHLLNKWVFSKILYAGLHNFRFAGGQENERAVSRSSD